MNIYNAIMKAADHIGSHPDDFDFMSTGIPACGTPGCALGWIGHFCAVRLRSYAEVSKDILNLPPEALMYGSGFERPEFTFYNRMDKLFGSYKWRDSAGACASTLRLYAEKYHGHEKQPRQEVVPWSAVAWQPRELA